MASNPDLSGRPLFGMFNAVPPSYDIVNRVVTWGLDQRWRRLAARECLAARPRRVLDLCCGTGDLAIHIARLAGPYVEVVGLDYSQPMLDIAKKKAAHLSHRPVFVPGDAASMPFPHSRFDAVGISFAFRNLTYKNPIAPCALAEAWRVMVPGGRFVIVESSQPPNRVVRVLFRAYARSWVRGMGSLISRNRPAYRYFSETVARFYTADEVRTMLLGAGFRQVTYRRLLLGAAAIHVALK